MYIILKDPEFEWIRKQTKRTLHETRQTLMYLLDASVRRRMCKKVLEVRTYVCISIFVFQF